MRPDTLSRMISLSLLLAGTQAAANMTLYTAKDVITMNPAQPHANAVLVKDDKIVAVGDSTTLLEQYKSQDKITVNTQFNNKVLTPGFVEPHAHAWLFAAVANTHFITPADWQLPWGNVQGVTGHEPYMKKLRALEKSLPEGEPLVTWGYHQYFHGEMSRELLDSVSKERPIVVWQRSIHEVYFNTAAMKMFNITKESWTGEGEKYDMVDWEKGHAWEKGLYLAAGPLLKLVASPEKFATALEKTNSYFQAGGLTTVVDPGVLVPKEMIHAMINVFDDTHNLDYLMIPAGNAIYDHNGKDAQKAFKTAAAMAEDPTLNGEHVKWLPKQIKLFADGAVYSQLMQMKDGYLDGHEGEWIQTPKDLEDSMRPYWQNDYTIVVHSNGDYGLEKAVDILEKMQSEKTRTDHRMSFHHLAYTNPADIDRAAKAGANFSVNPFYLHVLGEQYSKYGVGKERSEVMARGRSFLDSGAALSFHSDAPMAPGRPLALAWTAVNRTGLSGKTMGASEKLTVQESMKAITLDAAYAVRMEDQVGSIEPGKRANFTVLEQHPYKVDAKKLKDIEIWGTVFNGKPQQAERVSQGLVMNGKAQFTLNAMNIYDHKHGRGDSCEANHMLQEILSSQLH